MFEGPRNPPIDQKVTTSFAPYSIFFTQNMKAVVTLNILLLGCCTRFSCNRFNSQLVKMTITPVHPLSPSLPIRLDERTDQ